MQPVCDRDGCGHVSDDHYGGTCLGRGCECTGFLNHTTAVLHAVDPRVPEPVTGPIEVEHVVHPAHYNQYKGLEVWDLVEQMNFNRGNAVKYITRAGFKNPEKELEDLEKAKFYIEREIERIKG